MNTQTSLVLKGCGNECLVDYTNMITDCGTRALENQEDGGYIQFCPTCKSILQANYNKNKIRINELREEIDCIEGLSSFVQNEGVILSEKDLVRELRSRVKKLTTENKQIEDAGVMK